MNDSLLTNSDGFFYLEVEVFEEGSGWYTVLFVIKICLILFIIYRFHVSFSKFRKDNLEK